MLSADPGEAGVVAASGGNFGLAVGHAAREIGHRAEIFVPRTSPAAKIERVRATGADVRVVDGYYDDASAAAAARRDETGAVWMHPYDQLEVVAGQGTIGLELGEQVPDADSVLVSVGGGGLIGGIASWYAGSARVVGRRTGGVRVHGERHASGRARRCAGRRHRRRLLGSSPRRGDRLRGRARPCRPVRDGLRRVDPRGATSHLARAPPVGRARRRRRTGGRDDGCVPPRPRREGRRRGLRLQRRSGSRSSSRLLRP